MMECGEQGSIDINKLDKFDKIFFDFLYETKIEKKEVSKIDIDEAKQWLEFSKTSNKLTKPIVELFVKLKKIKEQYGATPTDIGLDEYEIKLMAHKHKSTDEHGVSVGGRVFSALPIVENANIRVQDYINNHTKVAPSGFDLQSKMKKNRDEMFNSVLGSFLHSNNFGNSGYRHRRQYLRHGQKQRGDCDNRH